MLTEPAEEFSVGGAGCVISRGVHPIETLVITPVSLLLVVLWLAWRE